MNHYIAIDIGGTKTAAALLDGRDFGFTPLVSRRYENREHEGIEPIIDDFLSCCEIRPTALSLGVAGVVDQGTARLTNLPWIIETDDLKRFGVKDVVMVNDMTAAAAGLTLLTTDDLFCLRPGTAHGEVSAVMVPGTGLGEGYLVRRNDDWYARGSEGGHCDFAPSTTEQAALHKWVTSRSGETVSYENVCAGPALGNLLEFLMESGGCAAPTVMRQFDAADDRTPIIAAAAQNGRCDVCRRAVDLFLSILGREAAHLALKVYATAGLYLGGPLLANLAAGYDFTPFFKSLERPGPMATLLAEIPVKVVVREDFVLLGVSSFGRRLLASMQSCK